MRKERLFYLDFIRAIATISIIMTHFNARYIYAGVQYIYKAIISTTFFNIYIGDWGVSLFFIISGAALMYVYQEKLEYKRFYKKRFESLYPMFWMAYIIAFIGLFYLNKGMFLQAPKKNFILTIIGFDGYLAANIPTFYILGEWFLGCIILFYVLFPLLRTGVNKYPKATVVITAMIYLAFIFFYHGVFDMSKIVFVRMPEFLMGMYFIKYIKKVNLPMLVTSIIVLALNLILKPQWSNHLQTTYVGISSFFILVYISKYFDNKFFQKVSSCISKYSYAIFLVHHVIIAQVMARVDLTQISWFGSYRLFALCCIIIGICAFLLFQIHKYIMKFIKGKMLCMKKD